MEFKNTILAANKIEREGLARVYLPTREEIGRFAGTSGCCGACDLERQRKTTMASRPELQAPPEIFYNDEEARKYTSSSRIIDIQARLSERALELLALPDDGIPRLLLDIGNLTFVPVNLFYLIVIHAWFLPIQVSPNSFYGSPRILLNRLQI